MGTPKYISTATTTQVVIGPGELVRIVIGETSAGAITIYDNTASTGTPIAVIVASIPEGFYDFGLRFQTGLRIVTAGASKLTVITE